MSVGLGTGKDRVNNIWVAKCFALYFFLRPYSTHFIYLQLTVSLIHSSRASFSCPGVGAPIEASWETDAYFSVSVLLKYSCHVILI